MHRSPLAARPLSVLSVMFSTDPPLNRCCGLQHGGLSQVWSTILSPGLPLTMVNATLCDLTCVQAPIWNLPYPSLLVEYFHGQHSSGSLISTFDQKRAMSLSDNGGIYLG